jgi:rhodanese-related sulfurtransferase
MNIRYLPCTVLVFCLLPLSVFADGADGNRYSNILTRAYHSEISAASSYLNTTDGDRHKGRKHHNHDGRQQAVLIDVRTVEEYVGGHPSRAYSIPFPVIYNRQDNPDKGERIFQDPLDFVAAVNALDLPKDTLIITMCRTGYRSVLAGNLLAAEGYTNVRNMWQGFVGRLKQNLVGDDLDLNGDGVVDGSDPYSGDRDGWANYQELPVSMKLKYRLLYEPYVSLYFNVTGER